MCLDRPAATARGARASRAGRDDHTFFRMTKTDPIDRAVGKVLSQLGGIDCPQGHPIDCVFPMPDAKDAEFVDKSRQVVFLPATPYISFTSQRFVTRP